MAKGRIKRRRSGIDRGCQRAIPSETVGPATDSAMIVPVAEPKAVPAAPDALTLAQQLRESMTPDHWNLAMASTAMSPECTGADALKDLNPETVEGHGQDLVTLAER